MRDIAQTRELLAQYPRNRHILYFLGCALAKQGQRAEAETVLGNLLDLYPDDQQAREAVKQITSSPETSRPATSAVAGANPSGDIVAIIAAYNEGDVIYQVLDDLIKNGIKVYFMDNASTDNTREEVSRLLGKGVIHIERFPKDAAASNRSEQQYVWRDILRRKTEIAKKLNAAWYIHADGDEFRESPWPGLTLAEAIRRVDALGFNALSFDLINFRPVDDHFVPGSDVREHMKYYEEAEFFNRTQIKAWKNTGQPVDLASSGGHQAEFAGRRIFPLPFLHRHYPIRGETHGRQKVLRERLPRFTAEERAAGWHVQYDCYAAGEAKFLKQPAELKPYDPLTARLELMTRALKDPQLASAITRASAGAAILLNQAVCGWMQEVTASKDSESAARTAEKEAIRTLALKAINADDFCKALKHFESEPAPKPAPPAVVSHQPVEATEVLLERAAAFFQASNWSEAGDIYRVLCRRLPNEITVWRGQIECSRQQNHTVLANLILAEALEKHPEWTPLLGGSPKPNGTAKLARR